MEEAIVTMVYLTAFTLVLAIGGWIGETFLEDKDDEL
tara:strand:- start:166 stop:276 length:111 start_codon:yes stop_codon:yes gene_type:complete